MRERAVLSSGGHYPLRVFPAQFRHGPRALAGIERVLAGRRAIQRPFHDALQNTGKTEHIVGEVEVPVADAVAPGTPAILCNIFGFHRDSERPEVEPADAARLPGS